MNKNMMPLGRDFYLSRTPHGSDRPTITHHRVISPTVFLTSLCQVEIAQVNSGRKKMVDALQAVTETEYRAANGLKEIVRSGA